MQQIIPGAFASKIPDGGEPANGCVPVEAS